MENKKTKIVSIIAIIALVLTLVTATYAYFQAQTGEGSQADVKINANTVDTLTFETGGAISLSLDQTSFAQGTGNKTGSTFAKAMLTANNKTNSATEHYYLYLNITSNTFTYTQNENTPEILLTIKDGSNNEITSINGLTHKTVTDASGASITGFDITNKNGLITIFDSREITTTSSKTEQWNVTITYINYDADQSKNAGKSFSAKLMIQKNQITLPLHISCSDNTLACHVAKLYTGTQGENSIYYHDGTLEYGIDDGSYRFAGSDYILTEKAINEGYNSLEMDYTDTRLDKSDVLVQRNSSNYELLYDSSTYDTYELAMNKAVSDGYLIKDNIKNFICFGSSVSPCPYNNLYRIIGVIDDKVKLIKYDYMTTEELGTDGDYDSIVNGVRYRVNNSANIAAYHWDHNAEDGWTNTWSESNLNKTNLNTNFINYLGTEWSNKIATTTWKVGGNTSNLIIGTTPSVTYQNEIINPDPTESTDNAITYNAKVGLIYISDYGFAANVDDWKSRVGFYKLGSNWMHMEIGEWTITRITPGNSTGHVAAISIDGFITEEALAFEAGFARAVFNLVPSVTYKSGSGTMSDPILIN